MAESRGGYPSGDITGLFAQQVRGMRKTRLLASIVTSPSEGSLAVLFAK